MNALRFLRRFSIGGIALNSETTVWLAIDTNTSKVIGWGDQSTVKHIANEHQSLSGNRIITRTLKKGMVVTGY